MSCKGGGGCSSGGCSGCGNSSINSIVELEIHYSETECEEAAYVFEKLYCITNIQAREAKVTGLEGMKFESLNKIRHDIIGYLLNADNCSCCSLKSVDFSYIKDDI